MSVTCVQTVSAAFARRLIFLLGFDAMADIGNPNMWHVRGYIKTGDYEQADMTIFGLVLSVYRA